MRSVTAVLLVHALSLLEPAVLAVSPHPNNTTTGGGRINIAACSLGGLDVGRGGHGLVA